MAPQVRDWWPGAPDAARTLDGGPRDGAVLLSLIALGGATEEALAGEIDRRQGLQPSGSELEVMASLWRLESAGLARRSPAGWSDTAPGRRLAAELREAIDEGRVMPIPGAPGSCGRLR